jgi:hypothetical protein
MYYVYTLFYPEEMGGVVFSVGKGSGIVSLSMRN